MAVNVSSFKKKFLNEHLANSAKPKSYDMATPSKKHEVKMNSKRIGNIGEAKVLSKFVELGIPVYLPFGDNEKADLIAEFNGKLNKIQVKTSIKAEEGKMKFDLTSTIRKQKDYIKFNYSIENIDYFALYNIERDKVFLISVEETGDTAVTIRYEPPKNGQKVGIRFEKDYLIENVLCVETLHETPKE